MSTKAYQSHEERTAHEPREHGLHVVIVDEILPVNSRVKLFRFGVQDRHQGLKFRAGQWLDVFVPGLPKAGGFTITSTPHEATSGANQHSPYVELAIQESPKNPPAAWLWQPTDQVLGQELLVRVGGSFTWPVANVDLKSIRHVVFIAGGVGINPLVSMLTYFFHEASPTEEWLHIKVDMLYTTKLASASSQEHVLFLTRLKALAAKHPRRLSLKVWLTDLDDVRSLVPGDNFLQLSTGRITHRQLEVILGSTLEQRQSTLCYVCGPRQMTDEIVDTLRRLDGVIKEHILCEKWW